MYLEVELEERGGGAAETIAMQVIPEEFKAAGLIVPDPSINSFPMPLSDLETAGVVWYIDMAAWGQRAGTVRPQRAVSVAPVPDPPARATHTHKQPVGLIDHTAIDGWLRRL